MKGRREVGASASDRLAKDCPVAPAQDVAHATTGQSIPQTNVASNSPTDQAHPAIKNNEARNRSGYCPKPFASGTRNIANLSRNSRAWYVAGHRSTPITFALPSLGQWGARSVTNLLFHSVACTTANCIGSAMNGSGGIHSKSIRFPSPSNSGDGPDPVLRVGMRGSD